MFGKKRGKLGVVIIHNLSAAWQGVSLYVCSRADISEKTERSCLKKVLVRSIIQQLLTSSTIHTPMTYVKKIWQVVQTAPFKLLGCSTRVLETEDNATRYPKLEVDRLVLGYTYGYTWFYKKSWTAANQGKGLDISSPKNLLRAKADKNNFLESNKFQLNPVKVVWQERRVDIEKRFWSQKKKTIETFSMIDFLKTDWNRLVLFIARNKTEGMRSLDFSWFESNFLRNRGVFWRVRVILSLRYRQPAAMHITWTTMHTRLTPWQQRVCMLAVGLVLRGSRSTSRGSTSTSREHWQRSWHPFSLASSQSCSLGH